MNSTDSGTTVLVAGQHIPCAGQIGTPQSCHPRYRSVWPRCDFGLAVRQHPLLGKVVRGVPRSVCFQISIRNGSPSKIPVPAILLLLIPAFVLGARYVLNNMPKNIEKLGFVLLAVTIGFTLVLDSTIPMLLGVLIFAAIELASYALRPKDQVQSTTHG